MRRFKLRFGASVSSVGEALANVCRPGDAIIVYRGRLRNLVVCCPCGCGEKFPVNLDDRVGPAWRLWRKEDVSRVTLFPSIWRDSGCGSHFIIWRGSIILFDEGRDEGSAINDAELESNVREILDRLNGNGFVAGYTLAQDMDGDPWDIISTCRMLSRQGLIVEGRDAYSGYFRLI